MSVDDFNVHTADDEFALSDDEGEQGPVFMGTKKRGRKKKPKHPTWYLSYAEVDEAGLLDALKKAEIEFGFRRVEILRKPGRMERFRRAVDDLMNKPSSSPFAMAVTIFILLVIILSTIAFIAQSWPTFQKRNAADARTGWFLTETVIIAIFTIEYCIRLLVSKQPFRFVRQPLNIVDLVAIIPYFVELIFRAAGLRIDTVSGLQVLRVIRIARVFRVFKLGRYSEVFQVVVKAFIRSLDALFLLLFFLFIGMVFFSSIIYFAEQTQEDFDKDLELWVYNEKSEVPGKVSTYQSIPHSLWWCIVTMTTVGYGDSYPHTPLGKAVAGCTMIFGLLLLAFPVGVLGAKFSEQFEAEQLELKKGNLRKSLRGHIALDRLVVLKEAVRDMVETVEVLQPKIQQLESHYREAMRICVELEQNFPDRERYVRRDD